MGSYRRRFPWRNGRIDGAQQLRDILAMYQPLYDKNVAFDKGPQPVGVTVWLTVAVCAGCNFIALTAHALRKLKERDFRTQFGAVGIRNIS